MVRTIRFVVLDNVEQRIRVFFGVFRTSEAVAGLLFAIFFALIYHKVFFCVWRLCFLGEIYVDDCDGTLFEQVALFHGFDIEFCSHKTSSERQMLS